MKGKTEIERMVKPARNSGINKWTEIYSRCFIIKWSECLERLYMEMWRELRSAVGRSVITRESQMTGHDRSVFRDVLVTRNACTRPRHLAQATGTHPFQTSIKGPAISSKVYRVFVFSLYTVRIF